MSFALLVVTLAVFPSQPVSALITGQKVEVIKGKKSSRPKVTEAKTLEVAPAQGVEASKPEQAKTTAKVEVADDADDAKGADAEARRKEAQRKKVEKLGRDTANEFGNATDALAGE